MTARACVPQGNSAGDCYVYDAASGQRAAHVSPIKVAAPVRACGLSPDCRHLVAAIGKGFIFRFEYLGHLQQAQQEVRARGACLRECGMRRAPQLALGLHTRVQQHRLRWAAG